MGALEAQLLLDLGIKTFWLDPCDDLNLITDYDKVRYHVGPGVEANCFYPVAHQKNVYDGLHAAGEPEVVTICRSSWAGSQRYGASPAAHDIASSFAHLREYLMAGLKTPTATSAPPSCCANGSAPTCSHR